MVGHIKLDRKILEWEWYQDANVCRVFIHLLLIANHKDGKWQGQSIKRGQLISGRIQLATDVGLSEMQIRLCLKKLKSTNEITIKASNKNSVITICKYDTYQSFKNENNQQVNQQTNNPASNGQPTNNQQTTTNNNDNNNKEGNNDKENNSEQVGKNDFEQILNPLSFPTWRAECAGFLNDEYYKSNFSRNKNIPIANVEELMKNFVVKLNLENEFKNTAALKKHFVNHYEKHLNGKTYSAFTGSKAFIDVPENLDYDKMEKW